MTMIWESDNHRQWCHRQAAGPFGRLDLFAGSHAYGSGGGAREYRLCRGLSPEQRREALAIVQAEYPSEAYGSYLDGERIIVGSAD